MMNIDDAKVVLTERKKDLKADLPSISTRISECKNQTSNIVAPDPKNLDRLESDRQKKQDWVNSLLNDGDAHKLRQELSEVSAKIAELKAQGQTAALSSRGPILDKIKALQAEEVELNRQLADMEGQVKTAEKRNQVAGEAMDKLRPDYTREAARTPPENDTCYACGQPLPADQIQAAMDRFNQAKAEKLKKINTEGLTLKAGVDARTKEIAAAKAELKKVRGRLEEITTEVSALNKSLNACPSNESTPEIKALEQESARIEGLLSAGKNGAAIRAKDAQAELDEIQSKIDAWKTQRAEYDAAEKTRVRIDGLLSQEKTLNAELEDVERKLHLIDRFIIKKVELLEDKINGMFSFAQFKMFKTLVNGNIQPCCDVLCDGVPFDKGLNTAARINTGLDIIQKLGDHFDLRVPVWIDNAESINELHQIDAQVIALTVSDDEKLTIRRLLNNE